MWTLLIPRRLVPNDGASGNYPLRAPESAAARFVVQKSGSRKRGAQGSWVRLISSNTVFEIGFKSFPWGGLLHPVPVFLPRRR